MAKAPAKATPKGRSKETASRPAGDVWMGALLFGATILAYFPALSGAILWDDSGHVTAPELQSLRGFWRIWFDLGATQQYYPLLHSVFWMEHKLWQDSVFGYHLTNVVLHAAAAFLLVMVLRRLGLAGAWFAGFVFALHPVCVEAVAWISEQKSTLSAVFYLSAALAYLHFDQTRRRSQYFLSLALFIAALLSKTVTATLPPALLVVLWWRRGRLSWEKDVRPLAPWFLLSAGAGLLTAWVEREYIGAHGERFLLTFGQRLLLACRVVWFYFSKLIWPVNLMFTYPKWAIDTHLWWQYLFPAGVILAAASLFVLARRTRGPLAGSLFFVGTLFPVLGFLNVFPFLYSYVADHFQYLASLGVIVPLSVGATFATRKIAAFTTRAWLAPGMAAGLLIVLGTLTWRQTHLYQDEETLFQETLKRNPDDWMAHTNLGLDHLKKQETQAAVADFEAALRIKPDLAEPHINLGNIFYKSGRLSEAIVQYQAAVRNGPNEELTRFDLAAALFGMHRLPEAIAELEAVLRLKPNDAEAHFALAVMLADSNRPVEAIPHLEAALQARPGFTQARDLLIKLRPAGQR